MLNTTSNTAAQSTKVSNILLYAHAEQVKEPEVGYIFSAQNFAKDWDSIYVRPSQLQLGEAKEGMRKLTSPTLVITSHSNSMAYILASEKMPVYIPSSLRKDKEGYLIAARLAPIVTPEYMFYMCQFEKWNHTIASCLDPEDWNSVGISNYDLENNREIVIEPLDIIRNTCAIEGLPSVKRQKEMVADAKEQETDIEALVNNTKPYNVSELISRYMMCALSRNVFSKSGLSLLLECYLTAAGDKANDEVKDILFRNDFVEGILSQEEMAFLASHLEDVFQQVVASNGMKYESSFGFIQPQEVTDFMRSLVSCPQDTIVYNPFAGANSYAIALPNPVVGEERIAETWALGQIRLFAAGATSRTNIKLGDSFATMSDDKKYKAIITSPAYLMEKGQRIGDIVSHLYDKLEEGGTLVCLVSSGFLFDRSAISIRKRLIEDKAIKCVITLPSNIFTGTGASQSALVISKGTMNEYVILADASGYTRFAKSVYRQTTFDWEQFLRDMEDDVEDYWDRGSYMVEDCISVPLPYDQIKDFDLTPSKYLVPIPADGIQLSEVAVEVPELRGKDTTPNYFITGSSIPASTHRKPFVPSLAGAEKIATAKNQVLLPKEAVIVAIVSGEIRTVYTEDFTEKVAFPGGFIKVLKPIEGISAKYLAAVLSTKTVSDQIKAQCVATVIPRLNRMNLSNIILPKFDTPEDREKLIASVISSEMSELESELQNAYDTQKREIRSTRHAMIQTLSALSSNWEQLKMFSELKGGKIDFTDVVGRINPISVERLMDSIGHAISTLERQVKALRFEKTDWGAETAINPYAFINEYIAKHSTPSVRMENKGKDNVADFPYFDDEGDTKFHHTDAAEVFYAPEKLLERIFNNIVANAKAHGFTSDRLDNEIRFDWMSDEGNIVITIANNGKPLKQGVTGNDVLMSGFTTALNKDAEDGTLHSGQGGYEIKSLMEGLGSVEVISEPEADFPVIYKLTFEKTNFETIELED